MKYKYLFSLISIAALIASLFTVLPVAAAPVATSFENWGPRSDKLIFRPYMSPDLEYEGLLADEIDFTDWTVTKEWLDAHCDDADIDCAPFYERGMYQFDLNMNCTFAANDYTGEPGVAKYCGLYNPTADVWFRRALCYLVNKTRYVTEVQKGLGGELITLLDPPPPYGPFVEYTGYYYDGPPYYEFDPSQAEAILDAHGWDDKEPDGTRNYPSPSVWEANTGCSGDPPYPQDRPNIDTYLGGGIDFVMRTDKPLWLSWSNMFADEMELIGIPVYRDAKDRLAAIYQTLVFLEYHIYAGGWSFGRDPLYVRDLYYSQWYIGALALNINYQHFNNSEFDYWGDQFYYADTLDTAQLGCQHCQRIVLEDVPVIPLVYTTGAKGHRETVCSGPHAGLDWEGMINEKGYGINTGQTYKNAHPAGVETGGTLRAGLSTDVESLNIIAAYMYYDYCVLDALFESPISYDPYNPSFEGDYPELASWWEVDTWDATGVMDPDLPGYPDAHLLTFHFANQTYWHDGTPVTALDMEFTIEFLNAIGPDYAWNQPAYDMVYDVSCPDVFTCEVYCNCQSIFSVHLVGGNAIIPRHIWENLQDNEDDYWWSPDPASWPDVGNVNPDWDPSCVMEIDIFTDPEYMIGTGPYVWNDEDTVPGEFYVLDAFAPGSPEHYWGWTRVRICGPNPLAIPPGTGVQEQKWNGRNPEVGEPQDCNNNWPRHYIAWETDHPQPLLIPDEPCPPGLPQRLYFSLVNFRHDGAPITVTVTGISSAGPILIGEAHESPTVPPMAPTRVFTLSGKPGTGSYVRLYMDLLDVIDSTKYKCDQTYTIWVWISATTTDPAGVDYMWNTRIEFHIVAQGDCNSDGVVDMADISLMIDYFGTSYAFTPLDFWFDCDVNKDNYCDMADISIAIFNFMRTCDCT